MRIYLADLGHNLLTYSSDVYPLGIANLATYVQANLGNGKAEISLFREPQDLKSALDADRPDILGLSNYAWNEELAYDFAKYAKAQRPDTLVCMGGPNYPLVDEVQESFLRGLPAIDCYIDGPTYEGERAFLNLVKRYSDTGNRVDGVFEEPIPGVAWIHPTSHDFLPAGPVDRIRDLDEIPSPYLAGLMDSFLNTGYFPMMQISRGCPFTCAFCNSGVAGNSQVFAHSIENVKQDLLYVAERIKPEITLCFADDNFGMYARDEEIADYIAWLQDHYQWPHYIRTTTGKNNGARIIRVMRKTRGALPMTAAVQSMNPVVLKNIKRANVKLETYRELQDELTRSGMQSYGELILCLPGETKASFMDAVEKLLDAGAKRISAHQLMLLHGAELANPDSRAKFGFDSRFRVVARDIGNYTGEPVIEVEEMVVATPDFSFEDYLETRIFHLLLTVFYYEGNFDEPFEFAKKHGLKAFDLVVHMQNILADAPEPFRKVIDEFVAESQQELFMSREACLEWARKEYDAVVDGTLGGNLLSKYSMLGRFYATQAALDYLEQSIASALTERGEDFDRKQLGAVVEHLRQLMLYAPFAEALAESKTWIADYDVDAWVRAGYREPLSAFRYTQPRQERALVNPKVKSLIETKIKTFGEHPSGLGKFTRTMFARELRRSLVSG